MCRINDASVLIGRLTSHTSPLTLAHKIFLANPSEISIAISIDDVPGFTFLMLPSGKVILIINKFLIHKYSK